MKTESKKKKTEWTCTQDCVCDPEDGCGRRLIKRGEIVTTENHKPGKYFEPYTA